MDCIKKFDSVSSYSRYLSSRSTNSVFSGKSLCSQDDDYDYAGTYSYSEAEDMMKKGDRKNLELIRKEIVELKIKSKGSCIKTISYTSFVGSMPHVPNYIAGVPKTMIAKKRTLVKSPKVITILYNPSVSCRITKSQCVKASVKVMNLINQIESKGVRVNLYVANFGKSSKNSRHEIAGAIVRIKAAEEYTNLLKLVYPMVNPSMHRRHFLRFIETADIKDRSWIGGYGYPIFDESEARRAISRAGIKFDAYFSAMEIINNGYNLKNITI